MFSQSRRQSLVATSSTEAEVVALSGICKPLVWMRHLLAELGFALQPSRINEDNKATMFLVSTVSGSSKSRHFMPRFMWTRSLGEMQAIKILKIDSSENVAEFLHQASHHPIPAALHQSPRSAALTEDMSLNGDFARVSTS